MVTILAIAACVYIFLMLNAQRTPEAMARFGVLEEWDLYNGKWWGLITSAFAHIEPLHLLFNMYWLWILGGAFESRFGSLMLLGFIGLTALVSGGLQFAFGGAGIGMSGVGYALLGFGWVARNNTPEFARVVTNQTIKLFVIWGVICIVATQLKLMNIGNVAHFGGLAFGAALAAAFSESRAQLPATAGVLALIALAVTPIYWNPLSVDWVSLEALKAMRKQRYDEAIRLYERSIEMGQDEVWALDGVARSQGLKGDAAGMVETLQILDGIDRGAANQIRRDFNLLPAEPKPNPETPAP